MERRRDFSKKIVSRLIEKQFEGEEDSYELKVQSFNF